MTKSTYEKPTLDEFITRARTDKIRSILNISALVTEPGFDLLYVRYGSRYILLSQNKNSSEIPLKYDSVLDLANLNVEEDRRGHGVFTGLVSRLRKNYPDVHLYVENVLEDRFRHHLLRIGFSAALYDSFFLEADGSK